MKNTEALIWVLYDIHKDKKLRASEDIPLKQGLIFARHGIDFIGDRNELV